MDLAVDSTHRIPVAEVSVLYVLCGHIFYSFSDMLATMKVTPREHLPPPASQPAVEREREVYKSNNRGKLFAYDTRLGGWRRGPGVPFELIEWGTGLSRLG